MKRSILAVVSVLSVTTALAAGEKLSSYPDLVPTAVVFESNGEVSITIANRGLAITQPFSVEVHLDADTRRSVNFTSGQTATRAGALSSIQPSLGVKQPSSKTTLPFQQGESRKIILQNFDVDICSGNHNLKVVTDSASAVTEAYENNNELAKGLAAPCPDLTVTSIKKNYNSLRTQYVAEVIVSNVGTGTAQTFSVATFAAGGSGPFSAAPDGGATQYGPLKAGGTLKFTTGSAHALESLRVKIWCDVGNVIKEGNEQNNVVEKLLMP